MFNPIMKLSNFLTQFRTLTKMGLNIIRKGRMTSKLVNMTKKTHGVSFPPDKQDTNMLKNVKCSVCKKSCVLYISKMLKSEDQNRLKKLLKSHIYLLYVGQVSLTCTKILLHMSGKIYYVLSP